MLKSSITGCWGNLFQDFCGTVTLISTVAVQSGEYRYLSFQYKGLGHFKMSLQHAMDNSLNQVLQTPSQYLAESCSIQRPERRFPCLLITPYFPLEETGVCFMMSLVFKQYFKFNIG